MEEQEEWRPVVGYEGLYEVSSFGNVKSLPKSWSRKGCGTVNRNSSIILTPIQHKFKNKPTYLVVTLSGKVKRKISLIHRLVAQAFIPNTENKIQVNHKDGNKTNNKASNLEWNTSQENITHSIETNLKPSLRGVNCKSSKLAEKQVLEIREKYIPWKYSMQKLANEYMVTPPTIMCIILRKTWTHI